MPNINITVADKVATNKSPGVVVVCGNSDYTITFDFDTAWASQTNRVARFVYYKDGTSIYQEVEFTGNAVNVPKLFGVDYVHVGVYAGDLITTTPAKVLCDRSILCMGSILAPPGQAEQLQDRIAQAVAEYFRNNPIVAGSTADKIIYVEVFADRWQPHPNGTGYYQIVATEGIPALSMVTIQLSTEQVEIFTEKALTFKTENHGGSLWITVVGQIPENDYVFQCKIEEVEI